AHGEPAHLGRLGGCPENNGSLCVSTHSLTKCSIDLTSYYNAHSLIHLFRLLRLRLRLHPSPSALRPSLHSRTISFAQPTPRRIALLPRLHSSSHSCSALWR